MAAMPESVGSVVVIRRNGKDGGRFQLAKSLATIGRLESCDIRIQLQYVSRRHAELSIANGKACLTNCSSVNPALLNGEALEGTAVLRHNDVFTIGDRAFRFEYTNPESCGDDEAQRSCDDADRTCQLDPRLLPAHLRRRMSGAAAARPMLSKIVESPLRQAASPGPLRCKANVATDGPKGTPMAVKKPVKTPQKAASPAPAQPSAPDSASRRAALLSESEVDRLVEDIVEGMRTSLKLSTPLRKDIESRRRSSVGAVAVENKENTAPSPPSSVSKARRLATPVRRAIESRRPATATTASTQQRQEEAAARRMPTPVKRAIQSRRRRSSVAPAEQAVVQAPAQTEPAPRRMSTRASAVKAPAPEPKMAEEGYDSRGPLELTKRSALPTPMRREIDARRMSYGPDVAVPRRRLSMHADEEAQERMTQEAQEEEEEEVAPQKPSALPTPVKRAIQSRRVSYSAPPAPVQEVMVEEPEQDEEAESVEEEEEEEEEQQEDAPVPALPSAIKRAIHSRRSSFAVEPRLATVAELDMDMAEEGRAADVEDGRAGRAAMPTPLKRDITARRVSYSTEVPIRRASYSNEVQAAADRPRSLATPIRSAINSRRQSYGPVAVPPPPANSQHSYGIADDESSDCEEDDCEVTLGPSHGEMALPMAPPASSEVVEDQPAPVSRGLPTPIKRAIAARRRSTTQQAPQEPAPRRRSSVAARTPAAPRREVVMGEEEEDDAVPMDITPAAPRMRGSYAPVSRASSRGEGRISTPRPPVSSTRSSSSSSSGARRRLSLAANVMEAVEEELAKLEETSRRIEEMMSTGVLAGEEEDDDAADAFAEHRDMGVTPAMPRTRAGRARVPGEDKSDAFAEHRDMGVTPAAPRMRPRRARVAGEDSSDAFTEQRDLAVSPAMPRTRVVRARVPGEDKADAFAEHRSMGVTPAMPRTRSSAGRARVPGQDDTDAFAEHRDMGVTPAAPRVRTTRARVPGSDEGDAFAEHMNMAVTPYTNARRSARLVGKESATMNPPTDTQVEAEADEAAGKVRFAVRDNSTAEPQDGEEQERHAAFTAYRSASVTPFAPRLREREPEDEEVMLATEAGSPAVGGTRPSRPMAPTPGRQSEVSRRWSDLTGSSLPFDDEEDEEEEAEMEEADDAEEEAQGEAFQEQRASEATPALSRARPTRTCVAGEDESDAFAEHMGMAVTPAVPRSRPTRARVPGQDASDAFLDHRGMTITPAVPRVRPTRARVPGQETTDAFLEQRDLMVTPAMPRVRPTRARVPGEDAGDAFGEQRGMAITPAVAKPRPRGVRARVPGEDKTDAFAEHRDMGVTPAPRRVKGVRARVPGEDKADAFAEQRDMGVTPAVTRARTTRARVPGEDKTDAFAEHRGMKVTPAAPRVRRGQASEASRRLTEEVAQEEVQVEVPDEQVAEEPRRKSLLNELGESDRIEEEPPAEAVDAPVSEGSGDEVQVAPLPPSVEEADPSADVSDSWAERLRHRRGQEEEQQVADLDQALEGAFARPSHGSQSPADGAHATASASSSGSRESQAFLNILSYLKSVREQQKEDNDGRSHDEETEEEVEEAKEPKAVKPSPTRVEPGEQLPTPVRTRLAESFSGPSVSTPRLEPKAAEHVEASPSKAVFNTDVRLVELYAKEMCDVGGVSPDYAWGVALDTYLADKIAFRKHLQSLLAQSQTGSEAPSFELSMPLEEAVESARGAVHGHTTEEEEEQQEQHMGNETQEEEEVEEEEAEHANVKPAAPARGGRRPKAPVKSAASRAKKGTRATTRTRQQQQHHEEPAVSQEEEEQVGMATRLRHYHGQQQQQPQQVEAEVEAPVRATRHRQAAREERAEVQAEESEGGMPARLRHHKKDESDVEPRATRGRRQQQKPQQVEEEEEEQVVEEVEEQQEEEVEEAEESRILIICDGCDGEFDLHEEAGLSEVPEGDWFCNPCTASRRKPAAQERTRTRATRGASKKEVAAAAPEPSRPKRSTRLATKKN